MPTPARSSDQRRGQRHDSRRTEEPRQYRDIMVRVTGFSEFFVNLTSNMQEETIARTKHM